MTPEEYEDFANLQAELDQSRREASDLRRLNETLRNEKDALAEEIQAKDDEISQHARDKASFRDQLEQSKSALDHQHQATANVDSLLQKAYADARHALDAGTRAQRERDNFELLHKDAELKLESLQKQWEDDQDKIQELEDARDEAEEVHRQIAELHNEIEHERTHREGLEKQVMVKDERINNLEGQVQKALQNAHDARAAAEAVTSPTMEPSHIAPSLGDNLYEELVAVDEEFTDDEDEAQVLDYSAITAIIDIAPIDPPAAPHVAESGTQTVAAALASSPISAVDIAPVEGPPAPVLSISTISAIDIAPVEGPPAPVLSTSAITSIDIAPVQVPPAPPVTESGTQTITAALSTSAISSIDMAPTEEPPTPHITASGTQTSLAVLAMSTITSVDIAPADPSPTLAMPTKQTPAPVQTKKSRVWQVLSFLLVMLCAHLWVRLRAWEQANTSTYSTSAYGSYGSPVDMDIGSSAWSEGIAKVVAYGVQRLEVWAEVNRSMPH
ncbi:hypothetical protein BCR34DRAFT_593307 [Clohesyomyces aquaticus]|uniref:Uncharacterized protein n=1 Tax=Clohesyomyces aquaticus TaxID=1231657 RepID=A0A1Y1YJ13_9PLEO|nr:hypothetical protein BCR34DRAFT_593307 [Clohesyomyces aquaticus]